MLAAASLDDVLAICAFGVCLGLAFGAAGVALGGSLAMRILSAPLQLGGGGCCCVRFTSDAMFTAGRRREPNKTRHLLPLAGLALGAAAGVALRRAGQCALLAAAAGDEKDAAARRATAEGAKDGVCVCGRAPAASWRLTRARVPAGEAAALLAVSLALVFGGAALHMSGAEVIH